MSDGVLWVTAEVPDRAGGGGNLRQGHLLVEVTRHLPVDLLVAGHVTDEGVRAAVRTLVEVPVEPRPGSSWRTRRRVDAAATAWVRRRPLEAQAHTTVRAALAPRVAELSSRVDTTLVHHQHLAGLLPESRGGRWLLHLFHVAGARAEQGAAASHGGQRALLRQEASNATRLERWAVETYDGVIVVSDADRRRLGASPDTVVVPNGVDLARCAPTPVPSEPIVLLAGSLGYEPNVDGAKWFVRDIWPAVRREVPAARLLLVGRSPAPELTALDGFQGISVHADVPDMEPWLRKARVSVVPLRIGTGTRLKAIEALAAGRPIVGTSIGLEGLGLTDAEASVADEASAFGELVVRVLLDDALAARRATAGRALARERFGWSTIGEALAGVLLAR